ncbi:hypothetical protein GCM10010441_13050 [Kitasatospora paracochleata]
MIPLGERPLQCPGSGTDGAGAVGCAAGAAAPARPYSRRPGWDRGRKTGR